MGPVLLLAPGPLLRPCHVLLKPSLFDFQLDHALSLPFQSLNLSLLHRQGSFNHVLLSLDVLVVVLFLLDVLYLLKGLALESRLRFCFLLTV